MVSVGNEHEEDVHNHAIYQRIQNQEPLTSQNTPESKRILLKKWMQFKWHEISQHEENERLHTWIFGSFKWLLGLSFLVGIGVHAAWGIFSDSIHVLPILFSHAFLPLLCFIVFLFSGNYWGDGKTLVKAIKTALWKGQRKGREYQEAMDERVEGIRSCQQSSTDHTSNFLMAYSWVIIRFSRMFSTRDKHNESTKQQEGLNFTRALSNRSSILKLWLCLQFQGLVVAYLSGFFAYFLSQLLFKSSAFYWGTTLNSIISPSVVEKAVQFFSFPWGWMIPPPTFEQIVATQQSFNQSPEGSLQSEWEAWALFLMMSILCWAILPRFILLFVQYFKLRLRLAKVSFGELRFEEILRSISNEEVILGPVENVEDQKFRGKLPISGRINVNERKTPTCLLVYEQSLFRNKDPREVLATVKLKHNLQTADDPQAIILNASPMSSEMFKGKVETAIEEHKPMIAEDRIVYLVQSAQSPKMNDKTRIEKIREAVGEDAGILILLLQDEDTDQEQLTQNLQTWKQTSRSKHWDTNFSVKTLNIGVNAQ